MTSPKKHIMKIAYSVYTKGEATWRRCIEPTWFGFKTCLGRLLVGDTDIVINPVSLSFVIDNGMMKLYGCHGD